MSYDKMLKDAERAHGTTIKALLDKHNIVKRMKDLSDEIDEHHTIHGGSLEIATAFHNMGRKMKPHFTGKGDMIHIDYGSHNASSKGKNSMSGGDLHNIPVQPHTGHTSANPVPTFTKDDKMLRSQNVLLNALTSGDIKDASKLLSMAKDRTLMEGETNKKTIKENADRLSEEIKLLGKKKRVVKEKPASHPPTTKKGRPAKGSEEAKEWGRRMAELRRQKK